MSARMVCPSQSRSDSRKLSTMIDTPIMAAIAMPSAATATPVRLKEAAMSPNASRATGLTRPATLAAARAKPRNTAGVMAATLKSSRKRATEPCQQAAAGHQITAPADTASTALTMISLRAMWAARASSTERLRLSCGALRQPPKRATVPRRARYRNRREAL